MRSHEYDVAAAQLSHAARVDPSDVNFLLLGEALRRAEHFVEADSALAQARKLSPDLREAQNNVGQILSVVGNDSDMAALRGISTADTPKKNESKPTH